MGAVGTESMQADDDQIPAGGGHLTWQHSAHLADGREIIYFDEAPGLNRGLARDLREGLAPVPVPGTWSPEQAVRWDPLLGEWVAIASHRQGRTYHPPAEECPLCPSRGRQTQQRSRPTTTTSWSSRTASRR